MAELRIRMRDDFLELTNGDRIDIPYEALRDACFATLENCNRANVTYIVTFTIQEITGYTCIPNNIRRSSMFNQLEKEILQHPTYKVIKCKLMEREKKIREEHNQRVAAVKEIEGYLKENIAQQNIKKMKDTLRGHHHYSAKEGDT